MFFFWEINDLENDLYIGRNLPLFYTRKIYCLNMVTFWLIHILFIIWSYQIRMSNIKQRLYYSTRRKHDCTSFQCILNWSTSVRGPAGFPQRKQMPRSTANSSVTNCTAPPEGRCHYAVKLLTCMPWRRMVE